MKPYSDQWLKERCTEDGDCLVWDLASTSDGCPRYTIRTPEGKKTVQVRRKVLEATLGRPLAPGMLATVTCGNQRCLCGKHLQESSKSEVVAKAWARPDVRAKKRLSATKTSRQRGKLDMEAVQMIRNSDKTLMALSAELGVSISAISKVRRREAWVDLIASPFDGLFAANDSNRRAA